MYIFTVIFPSHFGKSWPLLGFVSSAIAWEDEDGDEEDAFFTFQVCCEIEKYVNVTVK